MGSIYDFLRSEADGIQIIDTHEHLDPHHAHEGDAPDVLHEYFMHYITTDLLSAGMDPDALQKARDPREDVVRRYMILEPYLEQVRNTSYFRSIERAARLLHGVPSIGRDTIEALHERFRASAGRDGYARHVLREKCNIATAINHFHAEDMRSLRSDLFAPVLLPERMLFQEKPEPKRLDDFLAAYRASCLAKVADGAMAVKLVAAYRRTLRFEEVEDRVAADLYAQCAGDGWTGQFPRQLEDYLYHYVLRCADELGLPVQIHTGLQEGMGHNLRDSDPMLLKSLFDKYRNVSFDIFHMGYPYQRELMVLAKTHANVYIDMCWTHIISPHAARAALSEMLDVLPYTKIFGFGGDYAFYDGVAGHVSMAKENICEVLSGMIARRELGESLAVRILRALLRENAARVFRLA